MADTTLVHGSARDRRACERKRRRVAEGSAVVLVPVLRNAAEAALGMDLPGSADGEVAGGGGSTASSVGTSDMVCALGESEEGRHPFVAAALATAADVPPEGVLPWPVGRQLVVVLDMDQTLVGDVTPLADRENFETNIPWESWPAGRARGVPDAVMSACLTAGVMRPGLRELVGVLRELGVLVVVYTHSEGAWARKLLRAVQREVGHFVYRVFARDDCLDGQCGLGWTSQKQLAHVAARLAETPGLEWVSVGSCILVDDRCDVLDLSEARRQVVVPPYRYTPTNVRWDDSIDDEVVATNSGKLMKEVVYRTAVGWGLAPPSLVAAGACDAAWHRRAAAEARTVKARNRLAASDVALFSVAAGLRHVQGDASDASVRVLKAFVDRRQLVPGPAPVYPSLGYSIPE